jgi:hypothetical protein
VLNPAKLQSELVKIFDPPARAFPATAAAAADRLVSALAAYFADIALPPTVPGAAEIARQAALGVAIPMFAGGSPLEGVEAAAQAFAATLASMTLPPGVSIPPLKLSTPRGPPVGDVVTPAATLATAVHSWAITGQYIANPVVPAPVPWS